MCDWINGTQRSCTAFDFVTKGVLQEAIKRCELWSLVDAQGKAPGLIGWWPSRSVTFVDNHDTGMTCQQAIHSLRGLLRGLLFSARLRVQGSGF